MNRLEDLMARLPGYRPRYGSVTERPLALFADIREQPLRSYTPDPYNADNAYWLRNFGRAEKDWLDPPLAVPDALPVEVAA